MEENNSPRRTRSGKLLDGVIPDREAEGQEEVDVDIQEVDVEIQEINVDIHAVEEIVRDEIVVDVIDLTEDYLDVNDDSGDLGDVTEAASSEEIENGTITIVDDEASVDDIPTIYDLYTSIRDELEEDHNQGGVPDITVDLTNSPVIRSNFTSASTSGASLPSTSETFMASTSASFSGASVPSTSSSTSENYLPSTAPSNASAAVTCRICLDSQLDLEKEGHNLLSTVCGHIFCSKCLPNYIKERGLCPICRKVLRPKDFHQIFL